MPSQVSAERIILTVVSVVLVMISAVLHELGHAVMALRLGDDTAQKAGRITLNPLAHIDRFGSIILPLVMGLAGGPIFAFAKPVPYNPNKLRNPERDEVLVALAGPAANILQACVGALVCRLLWHFGNKEIAAQGPLYWVYVVFALYVNVNCTLAFFNLIPLPPLDGSAIISPLLKGEARRQYYIIQRYSLPILMVLLYAIPMVLHIDPLGMYLNATADKLANFLLGWS